MHCGIVVFYQQCSQANQASNCTSEHIYILSLVTLRANSLILPLHLYSCFAFQPICECSFSLNLGLPTSDEKFLPDDGRVSMSSWPLC